MADSRKSHGSRASGGSAAPSRLPSSRERRPALAALAVLLIVGGAFASGWLALQAGNRTEYLQVRAGAEIAPGQPIEQDDLASVELPEDFDGAIPASRVDELADLRAVTRLVSGTVLLETMLSAEGGLADSQQLIGLSVPVERLVSGMEDGSPLAINVVAQDDEDTAMTYIVTLSSLELPTGDDGGIGGGAGETAQLSIVVAAGDCAKAITEAIDNEAFYPARVDSVTQNGDKDCTGSGPDGQSSESG